MPACRHRGEQRTPPPICSRLGFRQGQVVYSGSAGKAEVLAYFSDRDEFEIVCRPLGVDRLTRLPVRPAEERDGPTWAEQMRKFQAEIRAGIDKLAARKIAA